MIRRRYWDARLFSENETVRNADGSIENQDGFLAC